MEIVICGKMTHTRVRDDYNYHHKGVKNRITLSRVTFYRHFIPFIIAIMNVWKFTRQQRRQ
jgi:hypothetical protein